jgi:gliding motility-associated-like protein
LTPIKISITAFCLLYFVCPIFSQPGAGKGQLNTAHTTIDKIACQQLPADFRVEFNVCDQHQVDFENNSLSASAVSWDFGDGSRGNGIEAISHVYNTEGVYNVMLVVLNQNGCYDTIFKDFLLSIDKGNIFAAKNLSVCSGSAFHMPGDPDAYKNCWSPATYLNATDTYDPLCTPLADIGYQYNIITKGPSLVANGNFSRGNTGFSSDYIFDSTINTTGYYFVGPKPKQWDSLYENCFMDTIITSGDTMMIVNGSTQKGLAVWDSTLDVAPNTNYIFGFYAQPLAKTDSLVLQTSINGGEIIGRMHISHIPCIRQRFMTTWYSGTNTSVNISITDLDIDSVNNNFALDSISLRSVYLKTDSIQVSIKPPPVFSVDPPSAVICSGDSVTLTASGGDIYAWYPWITVAQANAAATSVFPLINTTYKIVITESTCNITDSVFAMVVVKPKPAVIVSKSNDLNCAVIQTTLNATGGISYHWQPESTLSDPDIANPIAAPHETTMYSVQVTAENGCVAKDSVEVEVITNQGLNEFLVPTAFTPNNDGLNDCFGVHKWGNITGLQFFIYNRWGHMVFYTTDASKCWDGNYKNIPQPSGAYVYVIKGNAICGYLERKGTVVLLR